MLLKYPQFMAYGGIENPSKSAVSSNGQSTCPGTRGLQEFVQT